MTRSDALKKAQIKYRENHKEKLNTYFRNYVREHYGEDERIKKANYYLVNTSVFIGFRKLMNDDYR